MAEIVTLSPEQLRKANNNIFVYRPAGVAGGQVYTDMEDAYAAVLLATSASSTVGYSNIEEPYPTIILIIDDDTFPARPGNAAYDLSHVTVVPTTIYPNVFTIADGVNFSGANALYRGVPYFSGSWPEVIAECITTSLYSGVAPEQMVWRRVYPFKTGPSATVPAFVFTGGFCVIELREQAWIKEEGTSKIFSLSGAATLIPQMYEYATLEGNFVEDDGGGDEAFITYVVDPNSVIVGVGQPPVFGTTAVNSYIAASIIDRISAVTLSPFKTPVMRNPLGAYESTFLSEAMVKAYQTGGVIHGSTTSLIGDGIIFTGITYDTMTS